MQKSVDTRGDKVAIETMNVSTRDARSGMSEHRADRTISETATRGHGGVTVPEAMGTHPDQAGARHKPPQAFLEPTEKPVSGLALHII